MSFDDLSSELWLNILRHVGTRHFRRDGRQLTLSKRWYSIANTVLWEDINLNSSLTSDFIMKMNQDQDMKRFLERNIRSVCVFIDSEVPRMNLWPRRTMNELVKTHAIEPEPYSSLSHWVPKLTALSEAFSTCGGLKSVTVTDERCTGTDVVMLTCDSFINLSRPENITCLKLDFSHTNMLKAIRGRITAHLCEHFLRNYPNLEDLRVRITTICARALTIDEGAKAPPLKRLIINLNLDTDMPCESLPHECYKHRRDKRPIVETMQTAAHKLLPHLDRIQTFEILVPDDRIKNKRGRRATGSRNQLSGTNKLVETTKPWYAGLPVIE